jgi:hypothetical protein
VDIGSAGHLGQVDPVRPCGHGGLHVSVEPVTVQRIDAHDQQWPARQAQGAAHSLGHLGAGLQLLFWADRVLEIEGQRIGRSGQGLGK